MEATRRAGSHRFRKRFDVPEGRHLVLKIIGFIGCRHYCRRCNQKSMAKIKHISGGLKPTPPDERDFKPLGGIFDLPPLSELPTSFGYEVPEIRNQQDSDMCSAYSTCYASEIQEGNELEPSWSFAASKSLSGDPEAWGQDIRTALKAHKELGAVCREDAPYSLENKDVSFLRYLSNWPDLSSKSIKNMKKSYIKVTGPYDAFDNIRAAMWRYRSERRAVVFGANYQWPINQYLINTYDPTSGSGHMMCITGWDEQGLIITNSLGLDLGKAGQNVFSREVINKSVSDFGAYMFIDMDPEDLQRMIDLGIHENDGTFVDTLKSFIGWIPGVANLWKK